jgi:hypothetical protein
LTIKETQNLLCSTLIIEDGEQNLDSNAINFGKCTSLWHHFHEIAKNQNHERFQIYLQPSKLKQVQSSESSLQRSNLYKSWTNVFTCGLFFIVLLKSNNSEGFLL